MLRLAVGGEPDGAEAPSGEDPLGAVDRILQRRPAARRRLLAEIPSVQVEAVDAPNMTGCESV